MKEVNIYIDTYHTGHLKKGTGTYSIVLEYITEKKEPFTREYIDGIQGTTKHRTELLACIVALNYIVLPCEITLRINSKYVTAAINEDTWISWLNTGKNAKGEPVKNLDLWQQLFELADKHHVIFRFTAMNAYSLYMSGLIKKTEIEYKEDAGNV
jgi:ribonuclease HI